MVRESLGSGFKPHAVDHLSRPSCGRPIPRVATGQQRGTSSGRSRVLTLIRRNLPSCCSHSYSAPKSCPLHAVRRRPSVTIADKHRAPSGQCCDGGGRWSALDDPAAESAEVSGSRGAGSGHVSGEQNPGGWRNGRHHRLFGRITRRTPPTLTPYHDHYYIRRFRSIHLSIYHR